MKKRLALNFTSIYVGLDQMARHTHNEHLTVISGFLLLGAVGDGFVQDCVQDPVTELVQ